MHTARRWSRLVIRLLMGLAICLPMRTSTAQSKKEKKPTRATPAHRETSDAPQGQGTTLTPALFLIRDPVVLEELNLTDFQKTALAELAPAANEEAWKFRDVASSSAASEAIQRLNAQMDARLGKLLTARQLDRLAQIIRQIQGPAALQSPSVAEKLGLSATQRGRIVAIVAENKKALAELRAQARSGKDPAALSRQVTQLQLDLNSDLLAMLAPPQRDEWTALLGKPLDLGRLQPLLAQAPELRGIAAWINSQPLTLARLRGQVVALHFWTFG